MPREAGPSSVESGMTFGINMGSMSFALVKCHELMGRAERVGSSHPGVSRLAVVLDHELEL